MLRARISLKACLRIELDLSIICAWLPSTVQIIALETFIRHSLSSWCIDLLYYLDSPAMHQIVPACCAFRDLALVHSRVIPRSIMPRCQHVRRMLLISWFLPNMLSCLSHVTLSPKYSRWRHNQFDILSVAQNESAPGRIVKCRIQCALEASNSPSKSAIAKVVLEINVDLAEANVCAVSFARLDLYNSYIFLQSGVLL